MSSSNSTIPTISDTVSAQKRRKGVDSQKLNTVAPISLLQNILPNRSEGMNPMQLQAALAALTQVSQANAPPVADPSLAIINLASTMAINMITMNGLNQQTTLNQFAANPIIVNATKMLMSFNSLLNPSVSSERAPAELLASLNNAHQPNIANALIMQQYVQNLARQQEVVATAHNCSNLNNLMDTRRHMSLKRNIAEETMGRKRSLQSDLFGEGRKRSYQNSSPFQHPLEKHVPVRKDEMERCLHKILKEEIYNIFEDDVKEKDNSSTGDITVDVDSTEAREEEMENKYPKALDDIFDVTNVDGSFPTSGSAFRKVGKVSPTVDHKPFEISSLDPLWAESISPAGASPISLENEPLSPFPTSVIKQIKNIATHHREIKSTALDFSSTFEATIQRWPVIWQGQLAMKNQEANVQMHMVAGSQDLVLRCLGNGKEHGQVNRSVRINQRMRLEASQVQGVVNKLQLGPQSFACMICLPCGETKEKTYSNSQTFQSSFIDYFTQKQAAGIANIPESNVTQPCLVHIFPPGEFPAYYLQYFSQELYNSIIASKAGYLFIVLTPEEKTTI